MRLHYYPETEALLKQQTGAVKVVIFDHTIRVDDPGREARGLSKPVPVAAQVILAWQTIPCRQSSLSLLPASVICVGRIEAGDRHNIIPAEVRLKGSIHTVSDEQREDVLQPIRRASRWMTRAWRWGSGH